VGRPSPGTCSTISGLVAVAAALAGARTAIANDIDPLAAAAVELNAAANAVPVRVLLGDLLTEPGTGDSPGASSGDSPELDGAVVLAGDVYYSRDMAALITGYLRRAHAAGAQVLVGDPGRAYRPDQDSGGFTEIASYDVPVPATLENTEVKRTAVMRLHPARS
jgi:predicted nicotinamide N-methyase